MSDKKVPQTVSEVLKLLHEFLHGPEPEFGAMPIEDVRRYLSEQGIDPTPAIEEVRKQLDKALSQQELKEAGRDRERALDKLSKKRKDLVSFKNNFLERIREKLGSEQAAVYARKLEELDEEDLKSMVEDLEALKDLDDDDA